LGPGGTWTVFPLSTITALTGKAETGPLPSFTSYNVSFMLTSLKVIPGAVGELAFGKYSSPAYEVHPGEFIPPVGTLTGVPVVQGTNDIHFGLVIPSDPKPSNGWPVAIFGHGATAGNNNVF
jgi:hypothetical protein